MTDRELLTRFIETRDEVAFAELVRRHIDLVWGVGRRQVPAAADDIAQAVFLLLFQKAAEVRRHGNIPGWLFRTARYCCANLKRTEARRMRNEQNRAPSADTSPSSFPAELVNALDGALERLPRAYRDAVLVRYLQGKSITEAAVVLRLSEAAVAKRASRGLEKLRLLFATSGFALAAPAVHSLLTVEAAKAAPPHLAGRTTAAAFSPHLATHGAAALTHGAVKAAFFTPLKTTAATILGLSFLSVIAITAHRHQAAAPRPTVTFIASPATAPAATEDESAVPGTLYLASYHDFLLDSAGAAAFLQISHELPAESKFFTLRIARAADLRATLKSLIQKRLIVTPLYVEHDSLTTHAALPASPLYRYTYMVSNRLPNGINFDESVDEMPLYTELTANAIHLRFAIDKCQLRLQPTDARSSADELFRTASVHWSGALAPGDALLLCGDWGDVRETQLTTFRLIEAYKATSEQAPYIQKTPADQWLDTGPAGARHNAGLRLKWASAGDPTWTESEPRWIRTLPGGTVVRLAAITRRDSFTDCWWNPDGIPTPLLFNADDKLSTCFAAVQIFQPATAFHQPDSPQDNWQDGVAIPLADDENNFQIYVATGPWSEQTLLPDTSTPIGDDGSIRLSFSRNSRSGKLSGHLPPDTDIRLAAISTSGARLAAIMPSRYAVPLSSQTLPWTGCNFAFSVTRGNIDHYLLLTRKRQSVTFDKFALAPTTPLPDALSPADARAAADTVHRMLQSHDQWPRQWSAISAELARFDAIPRDPGIPLGAMRLMIDSAKAGDINGVKTFLHSNDPDLLDLYARAIAAIGDTESQLQRQFPPEPLMHQFALLGDCNLLETRFLEPELHFPSGIAYAWRNDAPLTQIDNKWQIDLDELAPEYRPDDIRHACQTLLTTTATLQKDLAAHSIPDPATAATRFFRLGLNTPPLITLSGLN